MPTPHRAADKIIKGVAGGAKKLVDQAKSALKGAGGTVEGALDTPIQMVAKKEGPHHIIGRALDGVVEAGANFIEEGIIGTAEKAGEAAMKALDHPNEQTGMPPGEFKVPEFKPPEIFKK